MSTQMHHSTARRITARCFLYAALASFFLFLTFLISDFGGSLWCAFGFGAIMLLIIANVISHPRSDSHTLLDPEDR